MADHPPLSPLASSLREARRDALQSLRASFYAQLESTRPKHTGMASSDDPGEAFLGFLRELVDYRNLVNTHLDVMVDEALESFGIGSVPLAAILGVSPTTVTRARAKRKTAISETSPLQAGNTRRHATKEPS